MSTPTILVVDDTPHNALLLCDLAEAQGYAAISAGSGHEALEIIAAARADLVLLDVVMPGLDGYDVCRAIRGDPATAMLPVVMVTALDPAEERIKGLEAGADDFLTKPIVAAELFARVRSLLRIKALHETVEAQRRELAGWNSTLQTRVDEQVKQIERLARLKRFFSPQLAERLLAGGADDPLRSHRREIAVVFVDLRGFTRFAAVSDAGAVMSMLREFHDGMGKVILGHEGTLERFTGDGMMIFFNDPVPIADPGGRAILMAVALQHAFRALLVKWRELGIDLGLAIGIARGMATIGAIGFEGRIDYGAIGLVTNLASRICDEARAGEILVDDEVLIGLSMPIEAEPLGRLSLKGIPSPVAVSRINHRESARRRAATSGL